MAYGILVPRPGIEPVPPTLVGWSLNHWTTREVLFLLFDQVILLFYIYINLFIYLFLAVLGLHCCGRAGLSLVAVSRGYSSLRHAGFSLRWLLLLRSTGSRRAVVAHGL